MITIVPARHLAGKVTKGLLLAICRNKSLLLRLIVPFSVFFILARLLVFAARHEHVSWGPLGVASLGGPCVILMICLFTWLQFRFARRIAIDERGILFGKLGRVLRWWRPTRCELTQDTFYPEVTYFRIYCQPPFGRRETVLYRALLEDDSRARLFIKQFQTVYCV